MNVFRYLPLVCKQVVRHPMRTCLTSGGVAVAMFLLCGVQAMQRGAERVTTAAAGDNILIVYRKDRFCPFASRMPESYARRIAAIDGVREVLPVRINVTNCRTSLDVVTFRGVPAEDFLTQYGKDIAFKAGTREEWLRRSDAALLGETLARRRGLSVGDRFDAAGVTSYVAGIIDSAEPQHQNVAYTHLGFLQSSTGSRIGGIVTQFNVRVTDPQRLEEVARAIDAEFASDQDPTATRSEKAFIAQAASDIMQIVRFTGWLGWGCLIAVLALLGNAAAMAVQERVREHAVLQTLGYGPRLLAGLIVAESAIVSLAGGATGTLIGFACLWWGRFAISVDGMSVPIAYEAGLVVTGLSIAAALGILAGLAPAWQAARQEIVTCFRAV
jgi:putative ABC transport system permease protein